MDTQQAGTRGSRTRLLAAGTGALLLASLTLAAPTSARAGAAKPLRRAARLMAFWLSRSDDGEWYDGSLDAWGRIPIRITVRRGETVNVRGSSPDTDLDFELLSEDDDTVAKDTRRDWSAHVHFHSHRYQTLTLLVENGSEVPGHYSLVITRSQ